MMLPGFFLLLAVITRLHPAEFPYLPRNLATDLQRRGCTIPQVPMVDGGPHNVIKGAFAKPGQTDWAVLCSVNGASSVIVFWNGSTADPAQIEARKDDYALQGWSDGQIVYSRKIEPVGEAYIMDHYQAYGGKKPPPIDHQGINDIFVGKASVVLYFHQGKWLHLTGAD